MNGLLGALFKFFCFVIKNEMTVEVQVQNFAFLPEKTNGRMGTRISLLSLIQQKTSFEYKF